MYLAHFRSLEEISVGKHTPGLGLPSDKLDSSADYFTRESNLRIVLGRHADKRTEIFGDEK